MTGDFPATLGMPGPLQSKPEDLSHPCQEQLPELKYCINDNPPWPEAIALGFQHYLVMLGSSIMIPSILVPMMGGNDADRSRVIQTILFVSGINTLLQTTFGTRLPTIVGGSFAFIIPTITIINSDNLLSIDDDNERFLRTMRAVQGAIIASSTIQIALGFSGLWGILVRFLSPVCIAPTIIAAGLGLYEYGFPMVGKCVEIGIPHLLLVLIFSQYLKHIRFRHQPIFELFPVMIGTAITWAYAHLLTMSGAYEHVSPKGKLHCRTDRAHIIGSTPWIRIPYPLQWGAPTFDADHVCGILAGAVATLIESTGHFYVISRLSGATPPPPYVISRGIGWEGLGILMDGMFGTAAGSTTSAETIGLIGLTKVGSRRVVQISAGFMICLSILGKFGGIFASIPVPMVGAVFCIMFAYLGAVGISSLQFCNMNLQRNIFIIGFSVFMAFSVPQYFKQYTLTAGHGPSHSRAHWFNDTINVLFSSSAVLAMMIATTLDQTLKASRRDRGLLWWDKFSTYGSDPRNLEFYKLPMGLNKFFPPT
ncbi:nucleobase-ascorbate transporter 2 isoform X1 [Physcomitrium patens]|uniref:Uncharacterized protein n=2 Tax=Physcomitrium patens TaxID=3218 RepID=A0A2K1IE46_PHYPA|nr:nucleobase-ascorbate transporter 2-like isoform X1 [Physcomitrium patens]PNR27543.1 hypothetical protein PHYPA_029695 [Physcomitrium patens]|eukprot:XP_024365383.1 nucleobase-ascorbate transporter 2-like isoform X1 [Physcomitrella patens]